MTRSRAFVTAVGILSPLGRGSTATVAALRAGRRAIRPLSIFPASSKGPLPVGEAADFEPDGSVPRTHALALCAAREAVPPGSPPPDAIVIGGTTGGMPTSEVLIKEGAREPGLYRWHGTGTVAEYLAGELGCQGPAWTISTACSSGTLALKTALELLRGGCFRRVLAGGADALCRLVYHGFNMLQLVDPQGARPLDRERAGITVSEAAAFLLLEAGDEPPPGALAEILGGGLSCDAYHPSSPHKEGRGAFEAMRDACRDSGVEPGEIDYINLHGTGSVHNDASEAKAVRSLFGPGHPPLSSSKGSLGHTLAAAGAVDAVIAVLSLHHGILPANVGCAHPDPDLGLKPVLRPGRADLSLVLSNSFGFGGNNAALVIGRGDRAPPRGEPTGFRRLAVHAVACVTGAGFTTESFDRFAAGRSLAGVLPGAEIDRDLRRDERHRLRRLPRMALALSGRLLTDDPQPARPDRVFVGTGWGPMTETLGFIFRLYRTGEETSSPRDFIASVHNAMAGHIAIHHGLTGPNVTTTGGDTSFEQALFSASLLSRTADAPGILLGVDEAHETMTPLLDENSRVAGVRADGGGALLFGSDALPGRAAILPVSYLTARDNPDGVQTMIAGLGGGRRIRSRFGAVFAGIPAASRELAQVQLDGFLEKSGLEVPVIDYRRLTGDFATSSAVAVVLAVRMLETGRVPAAHTGGAEVPLGGRGILVLGLGKTLTSVEIVMDERPGS